MSSSSKKNLVLFFILAAAMIAVAGCMVEPHETELPWATPNSWEGTMPLPSSMTGQYD